MSKLPRFNLVMFLCLLFSLPPAEAQRSGRLEQQALGLASKFTEADPDSKDERIEPLRGRMERWSSLAREGNTDAAKAIVHLGTAISNHLLAAPDRKEEMQGMIAFTLDFALLTGERTRHALVSAGLARSLIDIGDRAHADVIIDEALRLLEGASVARPFLLISKAQLATFREERDEALIYLRQAEEAAKELPDPLDFFPFIYGEKAEILLGMALRDLASEWVLKAEQALAELKNPSIQIRSATAVHRANLLLATERWELLEHHVDRFLEEVKDEIHQLPEARYQLLNRLGVALAVQELIDPNRSPRAESIFDSIRNARTPPSQHELHTAKIRLATLYLDEGRLEKAKEMFNSLHAEGRGLESDEPTLEPPLEEAHKLWIQAKLNRLSGKDRSVLEVHRKELNSIYDTLVKTWETAELRKGGIALMGHARSRLAIDEFIQLTLVLDGPEKGSEAALDLLLRAQSATSLARLLKSPRATISNVRSDLLTEGEGMLLYMTSRSGSHVFALDEERIVHETLPSRYIIEEKRRDLVNLVTTAPFGLTREELRHRLDELKRLGRDLGKLILPARIEDRLNSWTKVTVVSPGFLSYLPFECLILEDGRELGIEKGVSYLPSLPLGLSLAKRLKTKNADRAGNPPALTYLLVTAPTPKQDLPEPYSSLPLLTLSEAEESLLTNPFQPSETRILKEEKANLATVRKTFDDTRIVQFLVHGVQNSELERPAGLLLSPTLEESPEQYHDGRVWLGDLDGVTNIPDHVILTACGSGRGPSRWGDSGVSHFGGVMLQNGAATVVLPYAELEYQATLELTAHYLAFLADGHEAAEAMRRARVQLRKNPAYQDPFFSSLLHVRGLSHQAFFEPPGQVVPPWIWALGIVMSMLISIRAMTSRKRLRRKT